MSNQDVIDIVKTSLAGQCSCNATGCVHDQVRRAVNAHVPAALAVAFAQATAIVERWPICAQCEKAPAICIGSYDGPIAYACDSCCGHGCEDGVCYPLSEIPTRWQAERDQVAREDAAEMELAQLASGVAQLASGAAVADAGRTAGITVDDALAVLEANDRLTEDDSTP